MQLLVFWIEEEIFGIELKKIKEVIPLVKIRKIPGAPSFLAGEINYRGESAQIIDMTQVLAGKDFTPALSTRILIVETSIRESTKIIGFAVENATHTATVKEEDARDSGLLDERKNFVDKIFSSPIGKIKTIDPSAAAEQLISSI